MPTTLQGWCTPGSGRLYFFCGRRAPLTGPLLARCARDAGRGEARLPSSEGALTAVGETSQFGRATRVGSVGDL